MGGAGCKYATGMAYATWFDSRFKGLALSGFESCNHHTNALKFKINRKMSYLNVIFLPSDKIKSLYDEFIKLGRYRKLGYNANIFYIINIQTKEIEASYVIKSTERKYLHYFKKQFLFYPDEYVFVVGDENLPMTTKLYIKGESREAF